MAHPSPPVDPKPNSPPFLLAILISSRKSGDTILESLARDWLAEIGIRVVFDDPLDSPNGRRAVPNGH